MDILRLLRTRRSTGTDGPHRLVGNHGLAKGRHATFLSKNRVKLAGHHSLRFAVLALLQEFAHTQDRRETGGLGGEELPGHDLIAITVQGAPFGMADDRQPTAQFSKHYRRNFTGESQRHSYSQKPWLFKAKAIAVFKEPPFREYHR